MSEPTEDPAVIEAELHLSEEQLNRVAALTFAKDLRPLQGAGQGFAPGPLVAPESYTDDLIMIAEYIIDGVGVGEVEALPFAESFAYLDEATDVPADGEPLFGRINPRDTLERIFGNIREHIHMEKQPAEAHPDETPFPDDAEKEPAPSVTDTEIHAYATSHDISWNAAWNHFRGLGFDMPTTPGTTTTKGL